VILRALSERDRARDPGLDEELGQGPALLVAAAFDPRLLLVETDSVAGLFLRADAAVPVNQTFAALTRFCLSSV
jgi:hypothetical protein